MRKLLIALSVAAVFFAVLAYNKKTVSEPMIIEQIPVSAVTKAKPKAAEVLIWVAKSDGSLQCDDPKETAAQQSSSVDPMATELQKAGVKIVAKKKLSDGKMHTQMCGAETGSLNGFQIPKKDLNKAVKLGYTVAEPQPQ